MTPVECPKSVLPADRRGEESVKVYSQIQYNCYTHVPLWVGGSLGRAVHIGMSEISPVVVASEGVDAGMDGTSDTGVDGTNPALKDSMAVTTESG